MKWSVAAAVIGLAALAGASPAEAQYFGQNKVQYEKFDFIVMKTEHFDIYYYPEEEAGVKIAARMAERWYARLSKLLGHELSSRQPLVLYAAHPHFQQTNVLSGEISEGTGGVTEGLKRRVVLPFAGGLAETDHVLGHELVHAFQYDMSNINGDTRATGVGALPLWFIEGMAEYLSLGPVDSLTAMWVRDASAREMMPSIDKLDDPNFFPYRYGQAFWAYVGGRWDDSTVGDLFRSASRTGDIKAAMASVLGVSDKEFTAAWHEATRQAYEPYFQSTEAISRFGRPLVTYEKGGGTLNVAPSLSPDGQRVVFLSERSLFAIEMYVADMATGKVTQKLVKTAGDPHFESLEFIDSAGDWAPDGKQFVFAALTKGKPVLAIIDVDSGKRLAEHPFQDLDQIFNPAWSPDGHRVAFSALKGGVLDLFVYDLDKKQLTQLTDDPFADYDPEWSPNGHELAWVTDRFSANLDVLQFGGYRIGLIDTQTKEARQLAGFPNGRNTNPEFSADGKSLFFIGTPDGIANIYRVDMPTGNVVGITNVLAGVSGITQLTPALSVASKSDDLVFTAFEGDKYDLYAVEGITQVPGRPVPDGSRTAALLAPVNRAQGDVVKYLQTPTDGLPKPQEYAQEEYKPKLQLDAMSQPTVGIAADRWGTYGAGGISMLFSDPLGNHELSTYILLTSRFSEIGGGVSYLNKTHRWNWGFLADQSPYVFGNFAQGFTLVNNQLVYIEQAQRIVQTNQAITGLFQYPLSRAQRIEVNGGYRRISFNETIETSIYSPVNGQLLDQTKVDVPTQDSLNLAEASGALVYDSSIFGATSPILGQSYRLQYSQVAGSLSFNTVLADFRKYFMPVRPFTLAFRGMQYGRYGRDSENFNLSPLFLGYPGLVRGYDVDSFEPVECDTVLAASGCPVFDQLIGSRVAVVSAEIRFPLVGVFSRRSFYGPLPIEVAFFGDAGVAWASGDKPRFVGGSRNGVRSFGTALRFNLLGYLIGEFDFVKPIDRPEKGWTWQFNFTPGF